ncbi:MAG: DUF177 domain-containing protein [Candidatus Omnitrophica bacterium]|nr:DUF177 domain-containing protein [Candidatus Omnitrophota bacterium]
MKIHLYDYKVGVPSAVSETYDPKKLDMEFVDLKYVQPLKMEGTIEKSLDTLTFRGLLQSEVEHICGRCLKSVKDTVNQPFEFFYEIKGLEDVETLPDIREALMLDHPISFICSKDCRGLCPNCGINLNESKCNCASKFTGGSFSGVRMIRSKGKEDQRHG